MEVKITTGDKQLVADCYFTALQKCQKVGSSVIRTPPCRLLETAQCLTASKLIHGSPLGYLLLPGWYLTAWLLCLLSGIWQCLAFFRLPGCCLVVPVSWGSFNMSSCCLTDIAKKPVVSQCASCLAGGTNSHGVMF